MKLNCIIDNKEFRYKPSGPEIGAISRRIEREQERTLSINELAKYIREGKTYISGHFINRENGRTKSNFKNINFFSLDVDNHYIKDKQDIYTNYTREQVVDHLEKLLNIRPVIIYTTFSAINANNNSERFRLIYAIDQATGSGGMEALLKYIVDNSGDIFDKACTDSSRLYLATNKDVTIYDDYKLLDINKINEIMALEIQKQEELERQRQERKVKREYNDTNYSNDIIDELKAIDISDYLISQGYSDIEKYKDGYKMPCPIHNGKDKNFYINQVSGVWLYKCFSQCDGAGGSIIDLHAALNNIDTGQSIKELCEMYNIKPLQKVTSDIVTYSIEKYIGNDKNATEGILQAVKDNQKILITGAMGCGKTHFVSNDIYDIAKENEKVLIMVIPSQKQLENLYTNKDINVVYEKMPVYTGSDRVATTPESLPKITNEVGPGNYILIVDESHERYTSLYRTGYRNKNIEVAEKDAYRSIHLTATPRLLVNDNFDKVVSIETKTAISNKITIFKVKNKLEDNMLSIIKTLIKNNKKPILFNNNKETNELFARELEVKNKITIAEYKEGQIDIIEGDKPELKEITETIINTETIKSGKHSQNVAEGKIKADLTCTTSAVMAGIDLYTDDRAILVVNTKGLVIDNLIQLIGRFREGIEVILIVEDPEYKKEYFDLEYKIAYKIRSSNELANIANENKNIDYLMKEGLQKEARLERIEGSWIVNETEVIADVYREWSKSVFQDTDKLIELLGEQKAFKVEKITVASFYDEKETTMSDLKKISREEKKQIIDDTVKEILDLPDNEIEKVLTKDFTEFGEEAKERYNKYFKLAEKHIEKINYAADQLFINDEGYKDLVEAFKHFYNNSWASIEREIEQKQAREVNRLIKKHGVEFYLSEQASKYKTAIDVVQVKIRHELKDLENPRGRISNKRINELSLLLAREGYIRNKYTKIICSNELEEKDKEKALKCLADIVRAKTENIYNFDTSGKIQSPKI